MKSMIVKQYGNGGTTFWRSFRVEDEQKKEFWYKLAEKSMEYTGIVTRIAWREM